MNREILFKAKRKDNGEWVEGNLITNERNENQKYIGYIFDERNGVIEDFDLIEVVSDTICQYTGLNDNTKWEDLTEVEKETFLSDWNYKKGRRNKVEDWKGRKIWENDIISIHAYSYYEPEDDYFGVVKYCTEDACWSLCSEASDIICECFGSYTTEIINHGNIFDNADLLEVEE